MTAVQQTIRKSGSCTGIGLHTGVECTITFKPAPENSGIRFVRTDVEGCPEIQAVIDNVADISRGTTLAGNGVKVHTVEHVLAAAAGLEIDNLLIELTNKEPPVMDGSSIDFVTILQNAGIVPQKQPRQYLEIDRAIVHSDAKKNADIRVLPSDGFSATCIIDYEHTPLGTQFLTLHSMEDFPERIAPARTYCLLSEVQELRAAGLARGGSLENTLVIVDRDLDDEQIHTLKQMFGIEVDIIPGSDGILAGAKLRFKNEPVRHKVLDLIGDLALLGLPLKGHVIATKTGHSENVEIAKKISKEYSV